LGSGTSHLYIQWMYGEYPNYLPLDVLWGISAVRPYVSVPMSSQWHPFWYLYFLNVSYSTCTKNPVNKTQIMMKQALYFLNVHDNIKENVLIISSIFFRIVFIIMICL
jgi:hypothetical protein